MDSITNRLLLILRVNIPNFLKNIDFVFLGNTKRDLNLDFGDDTYVVNGCGATLQNIFWYFGGWQSKRQVRLQVYLFDIIFHLRRAELMVASWSVRSI